MIAIKSSEDLAKLIRSLAADIGKSHDYWQLRCDLLNAFGEHPLVEQQSTTFWSMTLHALESGAILHLCHAFDQQRRALGLRNWLSTIKANLRLFEDAEFRKRKAGNPFIESLAAEAKVPNLEVLTKDIGECSDKDPLVKRLIAYRGSALAHRSATLALSDRPSEDHPELTVDDVQTLLVRADKVLNRYSSLFAAEYYSQHVLGHDDYKFVIQSVESEVRRLRAEAGLGPNDDPETLPYSRFDKPVSGATTAHPQIVNYDPSKHRAAVRSCVIELQDFERSLEAALPKGDEVADAYLEYLFGQFKKARGRLFVAEINNTVVGFMGILLDMEPEGPEEERTPYACVTDIVVLPPYRRRGVARALMEHAEQHARASGINLLQVGVKAKNRAASELYRALGYTKYHVQLIKRI